MEEFDKIEIKEETGSLPDEDIMEVAILAGHILLENGAEIFRVEETIMRICEAYGVKSASTFVLSNGILASAGSTHENLFAKVQHIPVSGTHLDKVAAVNELSREIEAGKHTVEEAMEELQNIQAMPGKSNLSQIMASAIGSAAFCYLFGGNLIDACCAFFAGFLLYVFVLYVGAPHLSKIVLNVLGGLIVSLLCVLCYQARIGQHLNYMVIGSIMPLIPGVPFTNAIRDIADGDYISGAVRMLDALLVFICIAIGVGFGITAASAVYGGMRL